MIPDWLTETAVAHRGYHNNDSVFENSLPAFAAAVRAGFAIELDVQLTGDGELVVFHDFNLNRLTGLDRLVRKTSMDQIRALHLGDTQDRIPTLEEALDLVSGRVPLLIETKNGNTEYLLEDQLCGTLREYGGLFAIQSFNPLSLARIRKNRPDIPRGQLASRFTGAEGEGIAAWKRVCLRHFWLNVFSRPDFISYAIHDLPSRRVASFRAKGLPILGWTVRSGEDRETAARYCDNIIFEEC
ncbi:MAG: glycerophosphodiester phosphodiesterase [Clostridiales Family XIII bacterium]|nr:glycerophosphodiester phosphodiesterase [Clostridiales Family XIII bacterium]